MRTTGILKLLFLLLVHVCKLFISSHIFIISLSLVRIIKPNTPYAMLTMEHSIIHGRYFYSSSTMQESMFGLVHCFIVNFPKTISQAPSRYLLQRLVIFYYHSFVLNHGNTNCMSLLHFFQNLFIVQNHIF
jgi:hypothetical protein